MKPSLQIAFLIILLHFTAYGQDFSKPRQVSNQFLKALTIIDLPEGRQNILPLAWDSFEDYPDLISYQMLFDSFFKTDPEGFPAYRALYQVRLQNSEGLELSRKYLLVAYQSKVTKSWKVFDFRKSVNVDAQILTTKQDLADTTDDKPQFNYRRYAYWCALAGRLLVAQKAYTMAAELNRAIPDDHFSQEYFDKYQRMMFDIIGKK